MDANPIFFIVYIPRQAADPGQEPRRTPKDGPEHGEGQARDEKRFANRHAFSIIRHSYSTIEQSGMRIGITGVTGFIGSAVAKAARERGHVIVAYTRQKELFLPWAKEVRPFDPEAPGVLDPSGLDALIHLAGESVMGRWTAAKKARIRNSRVEITRRIVEGLRTCQLPPPVFLCVSATGAYGTRGDEVLTEDSSRGTGFLAEVCAEWEAAACRALALGMRVVLLRTGMVLGTEGGAWPRLKRIFSIRMGSRLGSGKQWTPWIHVDDVVRMILQAMEQDTYQGPVNLAAPNPVTNTELTLTIADLLGKSRLPPAPALALRLLLGEMSSLLLSSQRVQPQLALANGYEFKYPMLAHALATLV